jgi:hypothetical protein
MKSLTGQYKYINEETGDIFIIERVVNHWKWYRNGDMYYIASEYFDTKKACKQAMQDEYGPLITYSEYLYKKALHKQKKRV